MPELHPWEIPIGAEGHADRDITAQPYDRQEQRVVEWLNQREIGGGDDPIGYLMACQGWAASMVKTMIDISLLPADEIGRARQLAMDALDWHQISETEDGSDAA